MFVESLYLQDFRNFTEVKLTLDAKNNVLSGENAQGKTNLLEAVSLLSGVRSFRAGRERDLIRFGRDRCGLMARVESGGREQELRLELSAFARRAQFVNGVKKPRAADLSQVLRTVLFLPEDLELIRAGGASRRRFMDSALCQLSPRYASLLREYNRILDQKNRILKTYAEDSAFLAVLPSYHERMGQLGAGIISLRARFLRRLTELLAEAHGEISGGRDTMTLTYQTVSAVEDPTLPEEKLREILLEHFERRLPAELAVGGSLTGPQKDDFVLELNGAAARSFASQGQARTAAIALKLAERQLHYETFGEYPVLLLDDVLSDLDDTRRDYVLNRIGGGQVILTCCRREDLRNGKRFTVRAGQIEEEEPCIYT